MRTKLLKGKTLLLAGLTFALVGTAAGAGFATVEAKADSTVTVGQFVSWDGITFNGTSENAAENKTVIYTKGGWTRALVPAQNITASMSIELNLTANKATAFQMTVFDYPDASKQIATQTAKLEADTPYEMDIALSQYSEALGSITDLYLAFYFDTDEAGAEKEVTVNKLTVGGVSYTPTEYKPVEVVETPETSFKEFADWTVTNGTAAANTLDKLEGDAAEGTVDNAAANIAVTDIAQPVKIEIPLSQSLTAWPTEWTNMYVKVKATGISKMIGYIETAVEDNAFCIDCLGKDAGAWNAAVKPSVSDGYKFITLNLSNYFTNYINTNGTIGKIVLVPVMEEGATEASIEFGGMTFGKTEPKFINDIASPELTIGEWTGDSTIKIEAKGKIEVGTDVAYEGLKLSWDKTAAAQPNVYAPVSNFDAKKTSKLHIGFYTDSEITLSVYKAWGPALDQGHTKYAKGYHSLELDVSAISEESFDLRFWVDYDTSRDFEGTKNVVFDRIVFHNEVNVAFDEHISATIFDVKPSENGISWTYDVANVAGLYYSVAIPVENWYSFNRFIVIDVTLAKETKLSFFFNGKGISSTTGALGLADTVYQQGQYLLCYDLAQIFESGHLVENGANNLIIFCDSAVQEENSNMKKVSLNRVYFSETEIVPSTVVTVNYMEQTIDFDDTKYEVSASEDFGTLILKGGAVTPGTTLYVRAKGGASEVTQIVLEKPVLTADTVPQATVSDNYIRYTAEGYEYKFGENGEWTTLGSWGNLTAGTAYQIQIRIAATENSFASDIVTVTVTTTGGAETPNTESGSSLGGGAIAGIVIGCAAAVAIAAGVAVFVVKKRKK
ncbi:MAG: hypothetical protein HFE26_00750 [Clostridia bacterium]|nr:hypothetical protein [Clostridia bacterium]